MIKNLVRKYLLERIVDEAVPMEHFNERVSEVLYDIKSIQIPPSCYLPNIPKEVQDKYIKEQIQSKIQAKIDEIILKDYPIGGSCVVAPLGMIKVQPIKGPLASVLITAKKKEGDMTGMSYYVTIYDNRLPTLVLADPSYPANSSPGNQLLAHIKNTINGGYRYNKDKSFVEKGFMDTLIIPMAGIAG